MINIRGKSFETNSSSMDKYDNDIDQVHKGKCRQKLIVKITTEDDVSEERYDEIFKLLESSDDIECFLSIRYENYKEFEIDYLDYDEIAFDIYDMTCDVEFIGKDYPGDRYNPPEYAEPEIVSHDGFPTDSEKYPDKEQDKNELMKIFKSLKINEIIKINNLYGSDPEESTVFDNLSY